MTTALPTIAFDNSYARELEGLYAHVQASRVPAPRLLRFNQALAAELGLDLEGFDQATLAALFAGMEVPVGATPLAQAYAGHQFGGFSPQLGDGRALLLGEVIDVQGRRRDIALKGSGRTPFSRGGDGKAAVGPVLREYLVGEAMHALGVPTTRALAAVSTGEQVQREGLLPGAVLTRVAASHVRVGTFQYFAAHGEIDKLRRLADYVIARHDPQLLGSAEPYLGLLQAVAERQAALIARWMHLGFIHGVMNTDNMTISGETIDYGPCAFMEAYDPDAVFSSIDRQGRYTYSNQPQIARWNLARLAEALLPLMGSDVQRAIDQAMAVLDDFPARYEAHWLQGARAKLGLLEAQDGDLELAQDWLNLLHTQAVDFTLAWRHLAAVADGAAPQGQVLPPSALQAMFADAGALNAWLARWQARLASEAAQPPAQCAAAMRAVSPLYIPRNALVEEALSAASDHGDLMPFEQLLAVLSQPFVERPGLDRYAQPAPAEVTANYRTFCGT
ncbi:protein adenylyltransferase SelO [Paucibacter sp. KCTC 42545]|uniref:protein adenylyltransferase SelO n=1 Tax=Paucibacter sp. KCTC 42545 TaxID=1768242 RepID=UPI000733C2A5|nr:YdiU family protein [Paucibacter sp. KCTC 42545]ALT78144.1 hypothetical protein AT984_14090 [Paucibacter sp. KCTC 42545]